MRSNRLVERAGRWVVLAALVGWSGCGGERQAKHPWQGYCEGEFVYVASPLAGRLEHLTVQKGARVEAGAPLFELERAWELAAQREASDRLRQARARLEDLKKGQRPSEIAALEARLAQARAAAELATREWQRISKLRATSVVTEADEDRAQSTSQTSAKLVTELEAELATGRLGGRPDAIAAAEAEVAAAQAAFERAEWSVTQKAQAAPKSGLIYDTIFREGEFVGAGLPVVALLPPEYIKVRFFVPEAEFSVLQPGQSVSVAVTGRSSPLPAKISYLPPRPEYTPPVLYNRENRAKLVFMVEAIPVDAALARELHPGQPADVSRP